MKTTEQIQRGVRDYLTQTQKHLFKIGEIEHRILVSDNLVIKITGKNIQIYDIDRIIKYNEGNSKSSFKYILFRILNNKDIKAIRQNKDSIRKYSNIINIIKDKKNEQEIKNDILKLL